MKNKKRIIIGLIIGIFAVMGLTFSYVTYASSISNPLLVIKGVVNLELNNKPITEISKEPLILMGKEMNSMIDYMQSLGFSLEDQEGSIIAFKRNSEELNLKASMFTSKYMTWIEIK